MEQILQAIEAARLARVEVERKEFQDLLRKAQAGDAESMYQVAYAYRTGEGVEFDSRAEMEWLERAANAGDLLAPHNLGCAYDALDEFVQARKWYELAVSLGDSSAFANLGCLWEYGEGVQIDLKIAEHWYRLGVDAGEAQSQNNLAGILANEEGVEIESESARLFCAAAIAGIPNAMFRWAEILSASSMEEAEHWMRKAARAREVRAIEWLNDRGKEVLSDWEWSPGSSVGPISFGHDTAAYHEALGLQAVASDVDDDVSFESCYYPLDLTMEGALVVGVSVDAGANFLYRGELLIGATAATVIRLLQADDLAVDTEGLCGADCELGSDAMGIDMQIFNGTVIGLTVWLASDDPLWT